MHNVLEIETNLIETADERYQIALMTMWKCTTCGYEDRREEFFYEPSTGRKICALCARPSAEERRHDHLEHTIELLDAKIEELTHASNPANGHAQRINELIQARTTLLGLLGDASQRVV